MESEFATVKSSRRVPATEASASLLAEINSGPQRRQRDPPGFTPSFNPDYCFKFL
jgi:hypothetical protein